jgi:dihydrodipicolinate synthase/N-acetylneuraminate lyase
MFRSPFMKSSFARPCRREFLRLMGAAALGVGWPGRAGFANQTSGSKPLRGIFPIAQTPFADTGKLDLDGLAEEVKFIDRGGVHGFVWPQIASEWSTLTDRERLEGAETIVSVGKRLRPAIVIGVQGPDLATAVRYAQHAAKLGADAIISLPPAEQNDPKAILEYYKEVGRATELPLFLQAVGNVSVELILELYKAVPTLRFVKDEAGQPLQRIGPLRQKSGDQLKVFSGSHGRTLIEEMRRGFSGSMPAAPFADLYAATWDFWHGGQRQKALEMHAKTLLILTEMTNYGPEAMKYLLYLRGVFKTYGVRKPAPSGSAAGKTALEAAGSASELDEPAKQALRETLEFLRPCLKAAPARTSGSN